ncbi:MAG: mandelate racemase/muconate lactonizing enzyme family protein [Promethearchaeota archaeon]
MVRFHLLQPFTTAFGKLENLDRVFVRLTTDDIEAWGEAAIDYPFSGYDAYDIYDELQKLVDNLKDRHDIEKWLSIARWPAARAAMDMALLDLNSQLARIPLNKFLGLHTCAVRVPPLLSISIAEKHSIVCSSAILAQKAGYIPKLKLGAGIDKDFETVAVVIESLATPSFVALDANGAYSTIEGTELAQRLAEHYGDNIVFLEQPIRTEQAVLAMSQLVQHMPFPVVADESCDSLEAALQLADAGVALNLKLSKLGGLSSCLQLLSEVTVPVMIGGTFGSDLHRAFDQLAMLALRNPLPSDAGMPVSLYFPNDNHRICSQRNSRLGIGLNIRQLTLKELAIRSPTDEYRRIRQNRSDYEIRTGRPWDWNLA